MKPVANSVEGLEAHYGHTADYNSTPPGPSHAEVLTKRLLQLQLKRDQASMGERSRILCNQICLPSAKDIFSLKLKSL